MVHRVPCRLTSIPAAGLLLASGCSPAHDEAAKGSARPAAVKSSIPNVPEAWPFPLDTPAAQGERAMVVADQPIATEAGRSMLRDGGNTTVFHAVSNRLDYASVCRP